MINFASHYLIRYLGDIQKKYIVEIDKQNFVLNTIPFDGEIESTYWLNGTIILSTLPVDLLKTKITFKDFIQENTFKIKIDFSIKSNHKFYAYYLAYYPFRDDHKIVLEKNIKQLTYNGFRV